MELKITHTTTYSYNEPVKYALQQARLRPLSDRQQTVQEWTLDITGARVEASYRDHHGNQTDLISAERATTEVVITARGIVQTADTAGVLGKVYGAAPLWYFCQPSEQTKPGNKIKALAGLIKSTDDPLDDLHHLSAEILNALPYQIGVTAPKTTAEEALAGDGGVCQDHAQIMVAAARQAGLPARYVSGYLMMNDRVDQDASHAWAEVHLDSIGWVGFDVSNGICPDERYVRIATGRDARDAAPLSGMRIGKADESMIVSLQVQQ